METKFTEQESLSLISEMIAQTRHNFQRGAGTSFIFNGYMAASIALLIAVLQLVLSNPFLSFWAWLLMIPAGFIDHRIKKRVNRIAMKITHIDKIVKATWRGFTVAAILFIIVICGYGFALKNPRILIVLTPVIMISMGIANYITAKSSRFKPLETGAYILWGGALACMATTFVFGWSLSLSMAHLLIFALCIISAFVVPGYKMNKMAKEHV